MKIGTIVLQTSWPQNRSAFLRAEELGIDTAYVADHLTHPTMAGQWLADGWTTLAAAAVMTDRIRLGTLVASAAVRTPTTLARTAATLQDLSGGRLVLGVGAGSPIDAAADRGVTPATKELTERFAEVIGGVRALWSGQPDWVGAQVAASGVETAPFAAGTAAPPLVVAAHGPRGFAVVAEHADGWTTYGGPANVGLGGDAFWDVLGEQSRGVDAACERMGRDPSGLTRSVLLGYGPDRPVSSVTAFADCVARAQAGGFDEVVFYWPHGGPGSRFWADPEVVAAAVTAVRGG
jgi:alkanesulfonate monooxygenase SsuD/methylene tetrahydromethanopterin reductase-like flavin-dependent oxidoreductase (luciferase family)